MSPRSVRAGVLAAAGLTAFYTVVVGWASGLDHLATQAKADWYYLVPIIGGFGTQIALLVELRQRRRARVEQATAGAGAGASAVGMVACCAHHLADVAPIVSVSGAAVFLTDYRVELMLSGIAINFIGVAVAARHLWRDRHPRATRGVLWPAA